MATAWLPGWSRLALGGAVSVPCGCNLAEGLNDVGTALGDPDPAVLETPGRLLVDDGPFLRVELFNSSVLGQVVLAQTDSPTPALRIYLAPYEEYCEVLGVDDYIVTAGSEDQYAMLVARGPGETAEWSRVQVLDLECADYVEAMPAARVPAFERGSSYAKYGDEFGLLIHDHNLMLWQVRTQAGELVLVEEGVQDFRVDGKELTILRDSGLLERIRPDLGSAQTLAEDVHGFEEAFYFVGIQSDDGATVVWANGTEDTFVEGCGVSSSAHDHWPLLETECGSGTFAAVVADGASMLSFRFPTRTGRVQAYQLDHRGRDFALVVQEGATTEEPGPLSLFRYQRSEDSSEAPSVRLEAVSSESLSQSAFLVDQLLLRDIGKEGGVLTRLESGWARADGVVQSEPLLEDVAFLSQRSRLCDGSFALADYDGRKGNLYCVGRSTDPVLVLPSFVHDAGVIDPKSAYAAVHRGLRTATVPADEERASLALVSEAENGVRELWHFDTTDGALALPGELVAEGAQPGQVRPSTRPRGVVYLAEDNRDTLRIALSEAGLEQEIDTDVVSFEVIEWPFHGVLYSTRREGRDALRFSAAK